MNYSKQREIILNTLKENVVHPTAEYLWEKVKEKDPKISLATLYRNLNQLSENGIIKKTQSSTGFTIQNHDIVFSGICKDCNNNSKGE